MKALKRDCVLINTSLHADDKVWTQKLTYMMMINNAKSKQNNSWTWLSKRCDVLN